MKTLSRRCLVLGAFSALAVGPAAALQGEQIQQALRRKLGEDLLRAAEQRDWKQARVLLEQGADPNVTSFTPEHPIREGDWRARFALERPSALSQAAAQGNAEAVELLLRFGAHVNPRAPGHPSPLMSAVEAGQTQTARLLLAAGGDLTVRTPGNQSVVDMARYSGKREMIRLLEEAAKVSLYQRSVPQVPFAPGAQTARPRVVPGTIGAVPLRHLLWVSPHELLLLRDAPRRFVLLDLRTSRETELPQLSRRWAAQGQFEPDMLTLSPDGKWLLGFGGTGENATWLATEVQGDAWQEWPRATRSDAPFLVERHPLIAWMDAARWVELNRSGAAFVARVRRRGSKEIQQLPLQVPGFLSDFPSVQFSFPKPTEGRLGGDVGINAGASGGFHGEGSYVTWLVRVVPGPANWVLEQREVIWNRADYPGRFQRCVPSPDGRRLAWLNYFSRSEARAILVSDAEGKDARIVYEHLYPLRDSETGRAEAPQYRSLEWTPQGDALAFWRGENGRNGLGLLRLPAR